MNLSKSQLFTGTFLACAFCNAVFAKANEPFSPPQPPKRIETIHLPANVERGVVRIRLVVDQSGRPQKIAVLSKCDQAVETQLVTAVAKWQFTPAIENGNRSKSDVICRCTSWNSRAPVKAGFE